MSMQCGLRTEMHLRPSINDERTSDLDSMAKSALLEQSREIVDICRYQLKLELFIDKFKHFAVNGIFSKDGLIAYTINFDTSVGAFVGQCFTQDDKDVLKVTWLIKTRTNSSNEYCMTTRVGEDPFKREQMANKQKKGDEEEAKDDEEE
uniref:Uncharacterized protein n=1 Tax=Parascaris univalens TaxID=6257 RepID=A0A914ZVD4_PARUN